MRIVFEQAAGLAALAALTWFWLGLSEASVLSLLGSVVVALAILAGLCFLIIRGLAQASPRRHPAWLLGLPVAWLLVTWVPGFDSLAAQAVSMGIRWLAAYGFFVVFWVTLLSLIPLGKPRSTQPNTVAAP